MLSYVLSTGHSPLDSRPFSLDHFVRLHQRPLRDVQANLFRRFQVDDELELIGCSTGKSAGLTPFKILST